MIITRLVLSRYQDCGIVVIVGKYVITYCKFKDLKAEMKNILKGSKYVLKVKIVEKNVQIKIVWKIHRKNKCKSKL